MKFRALDKREYSGMIKDNFSQFCIKTYFVTPGSQHRFLCRIEKIHQDGSDEGSQHMVSMRNKKNYP